MIYDQTGICIQIEDTILTACK